MFRKSVKLLALLVLVPFVLATSTLHAQEITPQFTVYPWPNGAPGALGTSEADKPRMYVFLPKERSTNAAMLVVPGGGYWTMELGPAGFQIADWLNRQGMAAIVLDYRVAPYHYHAEIDDTRQAMRLVRAHAAEYGIDPNRIGVWGPSAGGHLASSLATHCEQAEQSATSDPVDQLSCKPDFMALEYPVIGMEEPVTHKHSMENFLGPNPDPKIAREYSNQFAVMPDTPPTFLFATTNDPTVSVENTLDFYRALVRNHVDAELHLFDYSRHGCGLCGAIVPLRAWPSLLRTWLIQRGYLRADAPPPPAPVHKWPRWPKGYTGPGEHPGQP